MKTILLKKDQELYKKIREHLADLHDKWQNDPEQDGHCKMNEGYVGILFRGDNWFDCDSKKEKYVGSPLAISMVEVYSYLFGPNRLHSYETLEEAWNAVKEWKYEN